MPFLTTALTLGGIAAAGSLGGAAIASSGAQNAAKTQSQAADQAAQLQYQESQNALNFQKQQYATTQQQIAPWLESGTQGLANLDYLLGISPNGTQGVYGQEGSPMLPGRTAAPPMGTPQPTGITAPGMPARPSSPVLTPSGPSFNGGPVLSGGPMQFTPGVNGGAPPSALSRAAVPAGTPSLSTAATGTTAPASGAAASGGYTPPSNLNSLVNPSLGAYGSLSQPWTQQFQAPTDVTEQNDPGYQFRLQQGEQQLQNSAAARGGLLTGGTARDINDYAQNSASSEYGNVYNRALQQYQQNYNIFENNQANQYNRLAAMAGIGQTAAGQLSSAGQNAANNVSNIDLTTGAQQGQQLNNAAAATASGYAGSANAYGGAVSGIGNSLSNLFLLNQLMNNGSGGISTGGV
jgi:hypothetical protein